MSNPATNSSKRPMLNTMDENYIGIRYRPKMSEKYKLYLKIMGICQPWSCMFCKTEEFYQSTYYQILENRIEWNLPGAKPFPFSCCGVKDSFGAIYFDDRIVDNVERAKFCSPIPCATGCFPNCFDIFGEGVVVYHRWCLPCCTLFQLYNCLEDGDAFRDQVKEAIKARKDGGAPAPVEMSN